MSEINIKKVISHSFIIDMCHDTEIKSFNNHLKTY